MIPIFPQVEKPTLLLDEARCLSNISHLAHKAQEHGVRFRPHFKTHQSAEVGEWFRPFGVEAITVSSVDMAAYFIQHGWANVTIAFPFNLRQMRAVNRLSEAARLGLLVESLDTVDYLRENLRNQVDVWIKIDTGLRRTGISWERVEQVLSLAGEIRSAGNLKFRGLLTHAGQTYRAESIQDIQETYRQVVGQLVDLKRELISAGFPETEISYGDTPACSLVEDISDLDEIRPGNFVFYDCTQLRLGACEETDIAVGIVCPVVAKHPERSEVVIYGGAVHLSKEYLLVEGQRCFGFVALPEDIGWSKRLSGAYLASISQEHGVVRLEAGDLQKISIGDLLVVLPVHSCLVVDLMPHYLSLSGKAIEIMAKYG